MKKVQPEVTPLLVSRTHAAQALGLSERSVDLLIKDSRLASVNIGRRVMVPAAALAEFAAKGSAQLIKSSD